MAAATMRNRASRSLLLRWTGRAQCMSFLRLSWLNFRQVFSENNPEAADTGNRTNRNGSSPSYKNAPARGEEARQPLMARAAARNFNSRTRYAATVVQPFACRTQRTQ